MQRWVLLTLLLITVAAYAALVFAPSWPTLVGAGTTSLLIVPVTHYFKAGRLMGRRPPRP
jgi:hypothetical protein